MIAGGIPTIYVSNLQRALDFYEGALGLKLRYRAGDGWAEVDAGNGLVLGLHGTHGDAQAGKSGSISVGLYVTEPIEQAVTRLQAQGVEFRGPIRADTAVKLAFFGDPDGNDLYLVEAPKPAS